MKELKRVPLDLQLFAEGGEGGETPETVSKEEHTKLKLAFDKTAKELADLKKANREKLSEEEKNAEAHKELEDKLKKYEDIIQNTQIEKELLKGGFTAEETDKIIKDKGDFTKLSKTLSDIFKAKLETAEKEWKEKINKDTQKPGGSNSDGDSVAIKMAKKQSQTQEKKVAWGNF